MIKVDDRPQVPEPDRKIEVLVLLDVRKPPGGLDRRHAKELRLIPVRDPEGASTQPIPGFDRTEDAPLVVDSVSKRAGHRRRPPRGRSQERLARPRPGRGSTTSSKPPPLAIAPVAS